MRCTSGLGGQCPVSIELQLVRPRGPLWQRAAGLKQHWLDERDLQEADLYYAMLPACALQLRPKR
jgi:hypothetical protein